MRHVLARRAATAVAIGVSLAWPGGALAGGGGGAAPTHAHAHSHATAHVRVTASTAPNCSTNCANIPFDLLAVNDCTNETVEITGFMHLVATTSISGDTVTMTASTNYQNTSGVALVTGTRYQANDTDHQYQRFDPFPTDVTESFDDNYELVSLSPTPNMIVHFKYHVHIDVFGVPTVGVDQIDAKCAGAGGSSTLP